MIRDDVATVFPPPSIAPQISAVPFWLCRANGEMLIYVNGRHGQLRPIVVMALDASCVEIVAGLGCVPPGRCRDA
ncbi:MAG TPA: hypothetical protein VNL18_12345 [Gemmatimonadales bacterium]|nr:hypothetical protein [Gemmatimonadales bacterium]